MSNLAFNKIFNNKNRVNISNVVSNYEGFLLSEMIADFHKYKNAKNNEFIGNAIVYVANNDSAMAEVVSVLRFVSNDDVKILEFPSFDTVPYDRSSPNARITAKRVECLSYLSNADFSKETVVVVTTVSAMLQKVTHKKYYMNARFYLEQGMSLDEGEFLSFVTKNGYNRVEQVMEAGEYAIRGGIIDIFPTASDNPIRIDLFGDEIEKIKSFDAISQKSIEDIKSFEFVPVSEVFLNSNTITNFRNRYRELFGGEAIKDFIYEAISNGSKFQGYENWMPLFYEEMSTIFDYVGKSIVITDCLFDEATEAKINLISDYYQARIDVLQSGDEMGEVYRPIPPDMFFISSLDKELGKHNLISLNRFMVEDGIDLSVKKTPIFHQNNEIVYDEFQRYVSDKLNEKNIVVLGNSEGSLDRLYNIVSDKINAKVRFIDKWRDVKYKTEDRYVYFIPFHLESGFENRKISIITEQDIVGEKLYRKTAKTKKAKDIISDMSELMEGDLVIHIDHGIGRFESLVSIDTAGAKHDCLKIIYADGNKLFVPVENIEVLSKFSSENEATPLDRLGSPQWQARKAKLKKHILEIADKLIKVEANRKIKKVDRFIADLGEYNEFCTRFGYVETDDQLKAIEDVVSDLAMDTPMDRLVCGDVGFGKTEVALRAAFIAASVGVQVAVVVPTTLLARQHFKNFEERFKGFGLKVRQLSRLVSAKNMTAYKKEIKDGSCNIVIGTHALLSKTVDFCNLGLLIVDEEQHFGVTHKEKLKEMKDNVNVLTLTATPIPRTMQLAMSGIRSLSVIATPPVDRLAVRTFITEFDPVVIKEAILRERFRGGQVFYVCPRVSDIVGVREKLEKLIPDVKIVIAHGQMSATELDDKMNAFAEGEYEILLSTTIIESGIDLPNVNTMIVHRADMFGLSQLYQLRGRIGRSKRRGYAYLTLKPRKPLTKTAEKRLQVMHSLDTLGAGFNVASYDMDIRGAGNLLGEAQSGHIKEVGVALFQNMLEEAIKKVKLGDSEQAFEDSWSVQINTGVPVLIPDDYVADIGLRLSLYRRIGKLDNEAEVEEFIIELIDRFGKIPEEVSNLLEIIKIKMICKVINIEKIDVGPRGAIISFRNNKFDNPAGLIDYISSQLGMVKIRPDHKLVVDRKFDSYKLRINGVKQIVLELLKIAKGI